MPLLDEEHARKRQRTLQKIREKANIELHPQRWAWLRFDGDVLGTPGGLKHGKIYRRKESEANNPWWDLIDQSEGERIEEERKQRERTQKSFLLRRLTARVKKVASQEVTLKKPVIAKTRVQQEDDYEFVPKSFFNELEKKEV